MFCHFGLARDKLSIDLLSVSQTLLELLRPELTQSSLGFLFIIYIASIKSARFCTMGAPGLHTNPAKLMSTAITSHVVAAPLFGGRLVAPRAGERVPPHKLRVLCVGAPGSLLVGTARLAWMCSRVNETVLQAALFTLHLRRCFWTMY